MEVLDAVELEVQHVDAMYVLDSLDDAERDEGSQTLAVGRALASVLQLDSQDAIAQKTHLPQAEPWLVT